MKKIKLFLFGYIFVIVLLFLYSYTQVDLDLTLSRNSIYQTVEKLFQYIGYFQRPLSTYLFGGILALLFSFYIVLLCFAAKNKINKKQFWTVAFISTAILTFSYNAFSYDLFNYIFDAKIFTHYHLNPYLYKALDFPKDPMLSFMHWTHRTYPYGPAWLLITVPLSFLGLNFFLPTFFIFKMLASLSFLGSIYFLQKITSKFSPQKTLVIMSTFAFNPLVLIESLVSAHIDIVMIFFTLWSIWLLMDKKYYRSISLLIISILIKLPTIFLIPVFLVVIFSSLIYKNKKNINWNLFFIFSIILMTISTIVESLRSNFQPWYILPVIPLCAFFGNRYYAFIPLLVISLFSLLQYVPFLYLGNWDNPVPIILSNLTIAGILLSVFLIIAWKAKIAFIRS